MPVAPYRQQIDGSAQLSHRLAHGGMLDPGGDHPAGRTGRVESLDRNVVRLRARGSEDHLNGLGAQEVRDFLAGIVKHAARLAPRTVLGAGVDGTRRRHPRIDGALAHRLGRSVVKIVRHNPTFLRALPSGPYLRLLISSVSAGAISCRSPTTPRSAIWKNGSSPSWLTTTMVPEVCMPEMCCIAPEIPRPM